MALSYQAPDPVLIDVQTRLKALGYAPQIVTNGYFTQELHDAVEMFQLQHIGPDKHQLVANGVINENTLWALRNPVGPAQKNNLSIHLSREGLMEDRLAVLDWMIGEHAKGVHEVPDGSNRSPEIDGYWDRTGVLGEPWCCAFVNTGLLIGLGHYPINGVFYTGVQKMYLAAKKCGLIITIPKPGDVFVQLKDSGKGHTGGILGVSNDGLRIVTVEGNCGNRVKMGCRLLTTIDAIIDPYQDGQGLDFPRIDTAHLPQLGGDGTR